MNIKPLIIDALIGFFLLPCHAAYVGIHAAAATGNVEQLKKYLADDSGLISARNGPNRTPLCIAAMCGQTEAVEFLISKGADVNDKGFQEMTPLADMAAYGTPNDQRCAEIAAILLAHGAQVDPVDAYKDTPLLHAVEWGKSRLTRVLLEHGASLTPTYTGANSGLTPLHWALRHRDKEMIAVILEFKPPLEAVDRDGATPLLWAVKSRKSQVARLLLEHGASLTPTFTVASSGITPSQYAFATRDNFGRTPLHWAVVNGDKEMVAVLLEFKAPFATKDNSGRTPLHWAVVNGSKEMVAVLLELRAPLDVMDQDGATPLFLAEELERTEIAEMLRQAAPAAAQGAPSSSATLPTREAMRAFARRIADGDATAFDELSKVAGELYRGIDYRKDRALLRRNFNRMQAAFNVLGEEAGKGNDNAFHALKKSLGVHSLNSFAPDALGIAAAAGHQESLNILLLYDNWGILESSANAALVAPAKANLQPVVDYFVALLLDPANSNRGVYGAAKEALEAAAGKGNQKAQAALEKFVAASPKQND